MGSCQCPQELLTRVKLIKKATPRSTQHKMDAACNDFISATITQGLWGKPTEKTVSMDNVDLVNPDSDHMDCVNADNPDQDLEVESHTSDDSPSSFSSKCNSFAYKTTWDHSRPLFEWQANLSN
ncbi:unnamed protein product [Leuciscus chuanchicus]